MTDNAGFRDRETGEMLYSIILDRGLPFKERLEAYRQIDETLGIETIPDDLETVVDELIALGTGNEHNDDKN